MYLAPEIPFAVNVPVDEIAKRCIRGSPVEALLYQGVEKVPFDLIHARGVPLPLRQLGRPEDEPSKRDAGDVVATRSPEPSLLIPISLLALALVSQTLST
jgi:hypothetical protein